MGFGVPRRIIKIFVLLVSCWVSVPLLLGITSTIEAQSPTTKFKCVPNATCNSIIDYASPNSTTLSAIKTLFGVKNLRNLLGVNSLPLSTLPNHTLAANQTVKIPFPCLCTNGSGISNSRPVYKVVAGDGLYHIAAEIFSGLVTYQDIQRVNNISNPDLIEVGQELRIPLPCSCDQVDGQQVVHYGYLVPAGSTVESIAEEFDTTQDTLLRLNGLASPKDLLAGAVLDVPLKACSSMVGNNSLDYPLLVPNGTYAFTAANCVMCTCDAAQNWTLQCQPSQINKTSLWQRCPSMQCQGAESLIIGNTTSLTSSSCNRTTCAYAGYTNQTIFTTLSSESTCPVSDNNAAISCLGGWSWNLLVVSIHLVLICIHLHGR